MLLLIVDNYSGSANWNQYTWLDEMKAEAIAHLVTGSKFKATPMVLRFDFSYSENKGIKANPFSFITTAIYRVFIRVNAEYKDQLLIRNELLNEAGATGSLEYEAR